METVKRGYVPKDTIEFGPKATAKLNAAAQELAFLLDRGYDTKSASTFVGNHHLLSERQRLALARITSPRAALEERERKRLREAPEALVLDDLSLYRREQMYCFCIFFNLPPKGKFTMEKKYSCEYTEKGILLYDDNMQPVFFEYSEYELYCHFYAGLYDPPIDPTDETQDQSLYMVLEGGSPSIREIRAYSHICKVNYVSAKKALTHKENFLIKGNYHYLREICQILDQYGVKYFFKSD